MKLVEKNPYRILGLLVGAKAAQFNRHRNRIPSYIDAGAELPVEFSEFSFESIGLINRTADIISEATAKLNLDGDKMIAALFWFYNGNSITDEPAFDSLKEADINQALSIWTKLTASGDVSSRNASAYSNLGTLYLSGVLEGTQTKELLFDQGISLKLKFLESDFIKDFKAIATDNTYKTTKKELQLIFLNQVQNEIEKSTVISSNKFLEILNKQSFSAKEDFMKGFVQKPIEQIEKQIQETKTKRKANKENAVSFGKVLFQKTSENLSQLKSILGSSNLKYASISDKVSDELLQCGIDYFAHYKESSTDPSSESMDLFRKAKTLGIGSIAKQRCQENTENLQEWIDDKPKRDKQKRILNDLNALLEIFKEFDNRIENILNAKLIINKSQPYLKNIKNILGTSDDLYLTLSTRIAQIAQHNIIEEVNEAQESFERNARYDRNSAIYNIKTVMSKAWEATILISTLDMESDFKFNRYNENKKALKDLCITLGVNTPGPTPIGRPINVPTPGPIILPPDNDFEFSKNAWWILGILGVIIGAIAGEGGGAFVGGILGAFIGSKLSD